VLTLSELCVTCETTAKWRPEFRRTVTRGGGPAHSAFIECCDLVSFATDLLANDVNDKPEELSPMLFTTRRCHFSLRPSAPEVGSKIFVTSLQQLVGQLTEVY
jgi:hypothetical protein